jgi:hypothetical protein
MARERNRGAMGADALSDIAARLRDERTPISDRLVDSPPAAADPLFVELVREGYLLHYETPRLLAGHDDDLALLAGDYLYALGIERLASLGDVEAIKILADLISDSARFHAEGRQDEAPSAWETAVRKISQGETTS